MKLSILLILFISLLSCGNKNSGRIDSPNINKNLSSGLKLNLTIIPSDNMEWKFGKSYTDFKPSDDEIAITGNLISDCFSDQKRGTVNYLLGKNPEDYNYQFFCAIDQSGDKTIWVNCFCKSEESHFKEWKDKLVKVQDGGKCFFNLKANITKQSYTDFKVNGEA